jgi:chromosomal replication initiator protein
LSINPFANARKRKKMVWESIKQSLQEQLPSSEFGLWIKPLSCVQEDEKGLHLACPDRFFSAWVEERYLTMIKSTLEQVCDTPVEVRLTVEENALLASSHEGAGQLRLPGVSTGKSHVRSLHPAYTFDQFMVGESNMLARSACDAIASNQLTFGNCLFMNSDTGLGKSHLSQGVVHHVMQSSPGTRMQYLTAQQFSAEMVKGIRNKTMEQFSNRFINGCDLLLVEDVHTLTGKTKTQEELNNVLDYLIKSGKRVILTSAVPPRKLKGLDEDFRSRMMSGLITSITAPEYQTRVSIIRHKAKISEVNLSDELVDYLAGKLRGDVRRIESALIGIKAKSCVRGAVPDMDMVREVLHGLVGSADTLTGATIRDFVGCQFKVSVEELQSRSRKRAVTFPRQVAMFLTRKYTRESLADIGNYYNRDHSTVLHSIKVITHTMSRKTSVREQLEMLCAKLKK